MAVTQCPPWLGGSTKHLARCLHCLKELIKKGEYGKNTRFSLHVFHTRCECLMLWSHLSEASACGRGRGEPRLHLLSAQARAPVYGEPCGLQPQPGPCRQTSSQSSGHVCPPSIMMPSGCGSDWREWALQRATSSCNAHHEWRVLVFAEPAPSTSSHIWPRGAHVVAVCLGLF